MNDGKCRCGIFDSQCFSCSACCEQNYSKTAFTCASNASTAVVVAPPPPASKPCTDRIMRVVHSDVCGGDVIAPGCAANECCKGAGVGGHCFCDVCDRGAD